MTRTRYIAAALGALTLALGGVWLLRSAEANDGGTFRFAEVTRGDIESSITSTGTLQPVTSVQVGTQVSGKVTDLYADFNDRVSKGQLIARIDATLQRQAVREAEANLARAGADLDRAEREFDRNERLYEQQVLTESEFNASEYNLAASRASLTSAEVSLERAQQNLAYTEIYSPIDGIVVERNVEPGQTVAASMSAPQLFLIAADLAQMEILASVDESDIGKVQDGQVVRFSVQAYPDATFEGVVDKVRLQSATMENVVNYTAVVSVANPEGMLLPGMTASVDFIVESVRDALQVANAALRYQPPADVLEKAGVSANQRGRSDQARLWIREEDGSIVPIEVRAGISDGISTAIESDDPRLRESVQAISGASQAASTESAVNPFQQTSGGGRPGGF
jgi:HlyD family secretion protein